MTNAVLPTACRVILSRSRTPFLSSLIVIRCKMNELNLTKILTGQTKNNNNNSLTIDKRNSKVFAILE